MKAESELRRVQTENKDIRQRWKQAARELDKVQRQGQGSGLYQITDNYLIDLITQLRYNIRSFSIQYFSERIGKFVLPPKNADFHPHMVATMPDSEYLVELLRYPDWRAKAVQAFLWQVLVHRVFDRFKWGGLDSDLLRDLCRSLRPRNRSDTKCDSNASPEAERKFRIWRATTVGLLLDSMDLMDEKLSHETNKDLEEWKSWLSKGVEDVIGGVRRPDSQGYAQEFQRIIDEALVLDKEISRQVSAVRWTYPGKEIPAIFDSSTMEAEKGEKISEARQKVVLVTSPGVVKRGKSTGEDFDKETLLLRMEVFCERPRAR
ncbi:hypothetical protein K458DRAFT_307514 [Lentithecium fluviatile CBS 122367]|uniref:Uncharacterized protein n=1 Tax=Lentithecium fluviatile CBS 122367 TaxID=1168545 RepID=A0A6G1IWX9_9PLEO|nr:hypothetical protein K458DRAFT_307514 [Lentithecium fluviatile CBS 122367]